MWKHVVFGGDPSATFTGEPVWDTRLNACCAENHGVPALIENAACRVFGEVTLDFDWSESLHAGKHNLIKNISKSKCGRRHRIGVIVIIICGS